MTDPSETLVPAAQLWRTRAGIVFVLALIVAAIGLWTATGRGGSGYKAPSEEETAALFKSPQVPATPAWDVPSALTARDHPDFPPPLVDLDDLRSGGPPPDGIPAINQPLFETVEQAGWLADDEPVVMLERPNADGEVDARAYPLSILTWHEIVNDTVGGVPVAVTYSPLSGSVVVFERAFDGVGTGEVVLDFGTSGLLWKSSLVMYDRQTESLWAHLTGQGMVGALAGSELQTFPSLTTSWGEFRRVHPDGFVLSRTTGYSLDYGRTPYPDYDDLSNTPFLFDDEPDSRFAAMTRVILIPDGETVVVARLDELRARRLLTLDLNGRAVVVLFSPGAASALDGEIVQGSREVGSVAVFSRDVSAGLGEIVPDPGDPRYFVSDDGTRWSGSGHAVSGPRQGARLEPVEHLTTFWFAAAAVHPGNRATIWAPR